MNKEFRPESLTEPFGLYIHIPFCTSKCRYCDFYSVKYNSTIFKDFLSSLYKEISIYGKILSVKRVKTIYFGGGTPSLVEPEKLEDIINKLTSSFKIDEKAEITLECNPSSLKKNKIKEYKKIGVNRLSLGIQSFCDQELRLLGRIHTSKEARKVIDWVKDIYSNFNIDLIFAIPGQNMKDWKENLKFALSYNPPHLSLYNLQIEEDTPLQIMVNKGEIKPVDNEIDASMYIYATNKLKEEGYSQYEISNFSHSSFFSRHNMIYWKYEPYIGLGPSAHSFTGQQRFYNYSDVKKYIGMLSLNKLPISNIINLTKREKMAEMMFMGLRLLQGVSLTDFRKRFKVELKEVYEEELNKLTEKGLVNINNDKVKLTEKGLLFGNEVFAEFL